MLLRVSEISAAETEQLNQGDVFPDVALVFTSLEVAYVEPRKNDNEETGYFSTDLSDFTICNVLRKNAISISYGCEFDRILRKISKRKAHQIDDVISVAAIFPLTDFSSQSQVEIRRQNSPRYLLIEESTFHPESVVDFSTMQSVPLRRLIKSSNARIIGLTPQGRVTLIRALANYLGSDERAANAGPATPGLLRDAIDAIGL